MLIKISVDTMLKVGGCRDLDTLLFLLAEHGCSRPSDLEPGKDKNNYLLNRSVKPQWSYTTVQKFWGDKIMTNEYFYTV